MKTDPYQKHYVNETQLRKLMNIYGQKPEGELVPEDEVNDIFETVFYCGRNFQMSGESALAHIAKTAVLNGETAKAGDIVTKLMEIRENL